MPAAPKAHRIRRATRRDLPQLMALEAVCFQPWRRASRRSLQRSLGSARQTVWVVDDTTTQTTGPPRLAALLVAWHHKQHLRIYDIATRPDLQGRGLGRALMAHADDLAKRDGCAVVSLEADANDVALLRWYERQGYAVVQRLPGFYAGGRPAVRLRKAIAVP